VCLELSRAQVDRVIHMASAGGNLATLLTGLNDIQEAFVVAPEELDNRRLSRSLLAGLMLLACFPADGTYTGIAELARLRAMNPSTVHRYVSTLMAVGLLERDADTRRYRLAQLKPPTEAPDDS
jgi:DNA-binding MarR family transcriptional regulator